MERINWSEEDVYGEARNPDTGDVVLVGLDVINDKMVCRINGGPPHDVARHIQAMGFGPAKTAMALLYEHITQCQAISTEEELTLP
jgi:hypothetical protein